MSDWRPIALPAFDPEQATADAVEEIGRRFTPDEVRAAMRATGLVARTVCAASPPGSGSPAPRP